MRAFFLKHMSENPSEQIEVKQVGETSEAKDRNPSEEITGIQTVVLEEITILLNPLCRPEQSDDLYSRKAYQKAAQRFLIEYPEHADIWLKTDNETLKVAALNHIVKDESALRDPKNEVIYRDFTTSDNKNIRDFGIYGLYNLNELTPESQKILKEHEDEIQKSEQKFNQQLFQNSPIWFADGEIPPPPTRERIREINEFFVLGHSGIKYSNAFKHLIEKGQGNIHQFLQSPHEAIRLAAVYWVMMETETTDSEKERIFKERAHDTSAGVRALAHRGLTRIQKKSAETKKILADQMSSIDDEKVQEAVIDKHKWAPPEDDFLAKLTPAKKECPYIEGLKELVENNNSILTQYINSPNSKLRLAITYWIQMFAEIDNPEKERLLQHLAKDTHTGVRAAACYGLEKIPHPSRETQNILRDQRLEDAMGDSTIDSAEHAQQDSFIGPVVSQGKHVRTMNKVAKSIEKVLPGVEVDVSEPVGIRALLGDNFVHGRTANIVVASIFTTIADMHPEKAIELRKSKNPEVKMAYCLWISETSTVPIAGKIPCTLRTRQSRSKNPRSLGIAKKALQRRYPAESNTTNNGKGSGSLGKRYYRL